MQGPAFNGEQVDCHSAALVLRTSFSSIVSIRWNKNSSASLHDQSTASGMSQKKKSFQSRSDSSEMARVARLLWFVVVFNAVDLLPETDASFLHLEAPTQGSCNAPFHLSFSPILPSAYPKLQRVRGCSHGSGILLRRTQIRGCISLAMGLDFPHAFQ